MKNVFLRVFILSILAASVATAQTVKTAAKGGNTNVNQQTVVEEKEDAVQKIGAAGPAERSSGRKLLVSYVKFMENMGTLKDENARKQLSIKALKETFPNGNTYIFNDIDTNTSREQLLKVFTYAQKLPSYTERFISKADTQKIQYKEIQYDPWRRYYFMEVQSERTYFKKSIIVPDSLASDSIKALPAKDTLIKDKTVMYSYFIRFDKENNVYKNLKIYHVAPTGIAPKIEPLNPQQLWWISLPPEWKEIFRNNLQLGQFPKVYDIDKIAGIYELNCAEKNLSTIEPIKKMASLEKLDLSKTGITSTEALTGLSYLRELNISFNNLTTLKGIETLSRLTTLNCRANQLEDLSPVSNLTTLTELDCSENKITDFSPLSNLINLVKLDISLNIKAKNIDPLRPLVNLEKLSMRKIDSRSIEALRNMINLKYLDVYNTNITSLEPIKNLGKIFHLSIDHNKITSLEPISNLKFISEFSMSSTSVQDLSLLRNFQYLQQLDVSNNPQLKDLGPAMRLDHIKVLKCHFTGISKEEAARFKKNHPNCQVTYY